MSRYNGGMEDELADEVAEEIADEMITLTPKQWRDLMSSIQSLSEANATLLRTISLLLTKMPGGTVTLSPSDAMELGADPYDLKALRRLIESGG